MKLKKNKENVKTRSNNRQKLRKQEADLLKRKKGKINSLVTHQTTKKIGNRMSQAFCQRRYLEILPAPTGMSATSCNNRTKVPNRCIWIELVTDMSKKATTW